MRSLEARALAATDGASGAAVILSENPMHDSGGGQRSAHLARELLDRGWAVLFVARGVVSETVDLVVRPEHPRLLETSLRASVRVDGLAAARRFLETPGALVLTQAPARRWLPVLQLAHAVGAATVYDCMDPWDTEMGRGWYSRMAEREIARASGVLIATSPALVERIELAVERHVELVPNAADPRVFAPRSPARPPGDEPRVALFMGALWGSWYDWPLVAAVAAECSDTTFVFVGDRRDEGRDLPDNCVFRGLVPNTELPRHQAEADVAFLPWRPTPASHAMSPVTVYEHVAAGLPVVSTPIEAVRGIPGVVVAADAASFADALRTTGRSHLTPEEKEAMASFAVESTWGRRLDRILELAEQSVRRRHPSSPTPAAPPPATARAGPRRGMRIGPRPTVSVVIPSYCHARYIGRAIDSARDQTLPAGEILVVDDGSTDHTLDVVDEHTFDRLRVLAQANRGAHAAINRAVALSEGRYVAILNSDDVFEPERIEHAWGVARARDAALVFGSVSLIDEDGASLPPSHETSVWYERARRAVAGARSLRAGIRRENVAVTTSAFFLHKELWRRLGGFAAYRYVHDYDFLLRALELCPDHVVYAPELCDVRYRVHRANTITEDVERALHERAAMLRDLGRPSARVRRLLGRRVAARSVRRAVTGAAGYLPLSAPVPAPHTAPPASPTTLATPPAPLPAPISPPGATPAVPWRVAIVVPTLDRGGLEEIVALLALALPTHGVEPHVLCTHRGGAVADRLRGSGVRVTVGQGRRDAWERWLRETRPDVASTHFADLDAIETIAAAGVPIVETIHNTYAWFTDVDWEREAAKARLVAAVIAVSGTAARYHRARCPSDRPTHVVPNAVAPGRAARVPRAAARRLFGVEPDVACFVHHGRIATQKNLPGLVAAFGEVLHELPTARLILAGPPGGGDALKVLRRRHAALFRSGAVRRMDSVGAVGALLSAADAYASNSFYEGWSVAASEALWVGIPVVISDTGGAGELVGADGARGRVVPNPVGDPLAVDPELVGRPPGLAIHDNRRALADALLEVARDRARWVERAPELRAFARVRLAPDRLAADYARILADVAGPVGTRVL